MVSVCPRRQIATTSIFDLAIGFDDSRFGSALRCIVGIDRAVAVIVEPVAFAFGLPRMDEFWTIRIAHVFIVATIIGDELFFANFIDDFFTNCIPIAIFVLFGIGYAIAIEVEIGAVSSQFS